jgi:hypothetical protein
MLDWCMVDFTLAVDIKSIAAFLVTAAGCIYTAGHWGAVVGANP